MRTRLLLSTAVGVALACGVGVRAARACGEDMQQQAVRQISIEQLAAAMKAHQNITIVDANGPETRAKFGVIPGAVLLSNYNTYTPTAELPADKNQVLVFYCGSTLCTAAPQAAQKAADAGYVNVYVMHAGIKGWTAAKQPTARPATTTS